MSAQTPSQSSNHEETSQPDLEKDSGWRTLPNEELPQPTYWPISLAFAIILILWGFVTTWIISAVGFLVLIFALRGWVGDILNE